MSIPIGVGLPATHKDVTREQILDWAHRADGGPFSSLCVLDRIIYQNLEPMLALAAAAAVTKRVKLVTGILLLAIHNAGIVAKKQQPSTPYLEVAWFSVWAGAAAMTTLPSRTRP